MGVVVPIPLYLQIAEISQFLSQHDLASQNALDGGTINNNYTRLLRAVRRAVQWAYNLNPNDPSTQATAIYMYQLCGKYAQQAQNILNNLAGSLPVITGPVNRSVTVGNNATFSVSVTSATPVSYQWYQNGVLIPGATSSSYIVTNAQLSQSGNTYFVTATNASGTVVSNTATLTVTAALVGYLYQGSTDYSSQLLAGTDNVVYLGTFPITSGQPLLVTFPDKVATEYIVVKYPATETTKVNYLNPPPSGPDAGAIPSLALEGTSFGGWKYIFSRTGNTFGVNGVNGQVQFS